MSVVSVVFVCLVALESFFTMFIEMFAWEKKGGDFFPEPEPGFFAKTTSMAANQGLYNGFLGAGLVWSALTGQPNAAVFFLACIVIAGVYGAATVTKSIFVKQALPALIALAIVLFCK